MITGVYGCVKVVIIDVKGLKLPASKNVYCTMELDGGNSNSKLQTGENVIYLCVMSHHIMHLESR